MKSYTDINQSKKLVEILPIESADMYWLNKHIDLTETKYEVFVIDKSNKYIDFFKSYAVAIENKEIIPCWSLAALSEFILPYIADNDGNNYKFYLSKDGINRWIAYYKSDNVSIHICEESDNMIDVILEMVCWLKENNYYEI